jgi:rhodanese-related sulfurtransferase
MNLLTRLFGPPLPSLSALEAHEKLKGGQRSILLDVREPQEFSAGHVAGAKSIPLGALDARMKELPKDREIICVCASGSRSRPAVKALLAAGYAASNLNGGLLAWRRAGLPTQRGRS